MVQLDSTLPADETSPSKSRHAGASSRRKVMPIDRCQAGRVSVFVGVIALSGGLMAQSAGQAPQQPATQSTATDGTPRGDQTVVDQVTGTALRPGAAPVSSKEGLNSDPGAPPKPDA